METTKSSTWARGTYLPTQTEPIMQGMLIFECQGDRARYGPRYRRIIRWYCSSRCKRMKIMIGIGRGFLFYIVNFELPALSLLKAPAFHASGGSLEQDCCNSALAIVLEQLGKS